MEKFNSKLKEKLTSLLTEKQGNYVRLINSIMKNKVYINIKNNILEVTAFLNKYEKVSMKERIYCILNDIYDRPFCKNCLNKVSFRRQAYSNCCSSRCVGIFNKEKIGQANKLRNKVDGNSIKLKRKTTCIERYGVSNVAKLQETRDKMQSTLKDKTGYEYALQNPVSIEKFKNTCLIRYGADMPSKTIEIKNKIKLTNISKYGVDHYWKLPKYRKLIKKVIKERYGVDSPGCLSKQTYSTISQELFWLLYKELPNNLKEKTYFKELNKEFDLFVGNRKQYFYDFVISNIKVCVEFNGDMWHANPGFYKGTDKHPFFKNLNNEDIWNKDTIKNKALEDHGYDILIIWESEYKSDKGFIVKKVIKFIIDKCNRKNILVE